MTKRILVLCASSWDRKNLSSANHPGYEFVFAGDELIENPTLIQGLRFDILAYIRDAVARFEGHGFSGIIGTGDYPACMLAAGIASYLKLPSPNIRDVVLLSHKFYSREVQKTHAPEATPHYVPINPFQLNGKPDGLEYPFFVKPVKGTMSIRAQMVADPQELRRALKFSLRERVEKFLLLRPFQHLLRVYSDGLVPAHHFIAETPLKGVQVTVDGFVQHGRATVMGIVDSVMYPGTISFERFEYPSRLSASVQERMSAIAVRTMEGSRLDHACFNVEMFYDEEHDRIWIIEINPRMSYQFGDLYERVDGTNTYEIQLALATGRTPRWQKGQGNNRAASSFVLRRFTDAIPTRVPSADDIARVQERFPRTEVRILCTVGERLGAQDQDVGSFRYAIINMGALTKEQLHADYAAVKTLLPFEFRSV